MRLFIAIPLPDAVKNYMEELQGNLHGSMSFPKKEAMHLTLFFIGDFDDVELIKNKLKSINHEPFSLTTDAVGVLGSTHFLRIVYLALKDSSELKNLVTAIEKTLPVKKDKPFFPHLTLARIKYLSEDERTVLKNTIQQINKNNQTIPFSVDSIILYSSELQKSGAVHTALETYMLK
ncbi:RNA 2',3'-cyclic phosphodiesterase [Candidatus Woesearchaeota archaeon]|nr:MAG: RNA 2',3'-cyclic phosphodiesterase [Candidatus Woesearchaeota archaeon]